VTASSVMGGRARGPRDLPVAKSAVQSDASCAGAPVAVLKALVVTTAERPVFRQRDRISAASARPARMRLSAGRRIARRPRCGAPGDGLGRTKTLSMCCDVNAASCLVGGCATSPTWWTRVFRPVMLDNLRSPSRTNRNHHAGMCWAPTDLAFLVPKLAVRGAGSPVLPRPVQRTRRGSLSFCWQTLYRNFASPAASIVGRPAVSTRDSAVQSAPSPAAAPQ
jgi:hypothetical protein